MIPTVITQTQARIAETYWGKSWTFLCAEQVEEALDWYWYCHYRRRIVFRSES